MTISTNDALQRQLTFITEVEALKRVLRQTVTVDGRQENTAEHSWHVCVLAMAMHEHADDPDVDLSKVIRMLLLHDIVEIDAGDTFAFGAAGHTDKHDREQAAAQRLYALLPEGQRGTWLALWNEFEAVQTKESKFANAMDRLLPVVQAVSARGGSWVRHGVSRAQVERRVAIIEQVSRPLWTHVTELLDHAVEQGMLRA
ncbi:HD domain-containing protein [Deinococcus pimensis]|uniref:HD domain-containing protein n=1 Tax=Deinococcus pimensis TaxID=309888 RepID=UPI0004818F1C|nr:HD domain-containing protein [Deinococcus pimensis]